MTTATTTKLTPAVWTPGLPPLPEPDKETKSIFLLTHPTWVFPALVYWKFHEKHGKRYLYFYDTYIDDAIGPCLDEDEFEDELKSSTGYSFIYIYEDDQV